MKREKPAPTETVPAADHANPAAGGCYVRQPDGSLVPDPDHPAVDVSAAAPEAARGDAGEIQSEDA